MKAALYLCILLQQNSLLQSKQGKKKSDNPGEGHFTKYVTGTPEIYQGHQKRRKV